MAEQEQDVLKVFISSRNSVCSECGEDLGHGAWIFLVPAGGAICMECADLDHLVYLPSGNTALTRRVKKHSQLSAVVLKFSRSRRRYERQGLLVEEEALGKAEQECLADEDIRIRRRERDAVRREEFDERHVLEFAARIRELYPCCPPERERAIAEHACRKYSGRVGRSAAAKEFDEQAIRMAVVAHVRHTETKCDTLLARGLERMEARHEVAGSIERVLGEWERVPISCTNSQ